MPGSEQKARSMRRKFYHCGSHPLYSLATDAKVEKIRKDFEGGKINDSQARNKIAQIQQQNRIILSMPGRGTPIRVG